MNTPIQRWYLPGIPDGFEVYIKRDDMLGCELTGNKVSASCDQEPGKGGGGLKCIW